MAEMKKEVKKKKMTKAELEEALIENFVSLQKVMTNLSIKFETLSDNISKLLNLFEISAKSFTEKQDRPESEINGDLAQKIDTLLEQNKIIAKGITLIEEATRERPASPFQPQSLPRY